MPNAQCTMQVTPIVLEYSPVGRVAAVVGGCFASYLTVSAVDTRILLNWPFGGCTYSPT